MKRQTVYVLSRGMDNKGGYVVGIYANRLDACAAATRLRCHFEPWRLDPRGPLEPMIWHSGCDWVKVENHYVRKGQV